MRYHLIFILLFVFIFSESFAQNLIWPTDASQYLTSSFAEYRSGHFHAGIDVKTWGKEGYRVFAIGDGYIRRIRVSPFGYGKSIYLRLNTGQTVIFAHLQKFTDEIDQIIKSEQKTKGEYRLDKYFRSFELPVKQGDIIGFSGATGIGDPHLHFEIRDKYNQPTNPFLYGYNVEDSIPPIVSAISISPLNYESRVNSDATPLILKPRRHSYGKYQVDSIVTLSGDIGFAIDCYDMANGVSNKFAVYRLNFYIDGELKFSAVYNRFSYDYTHLIIFERDYRLHKRGLGIFQKLYREDENILPFYTPDENKIGILHCQPGDENMTNDKGIYGYGSHHYRIEAADFFGNVSAVEGKFIVAEKRQIFSKVTSITNKQFYINDVYDDEGSTITEPRYYISSDEGRTWKRYNISQNLELKFSSDIYSNPIKILKILAEDEFGEATFPFYQALVVDSVSRVSPVECRIEKDFYDDYLRLELGMNGTLGSLPRLFVQQTGNIPLEVSLIQNTFNNYFGVYKLIPEKDGTMEIEVRVHDIAGNEFFFWDQFDIRTVTPERGGEIISKDNCCHVKFGSKYVYRNLFLRISEVDEPDSNKYESVGLAYHIEPMDIPLRRSAVVTLKYPETDSLPEKLGVYGSTKKNRWNFVGNRLNKENRTISTQLSSLRFVTLIRDTIPPEITILSPPVNGNERFPMLKAMVRDRLSGISSERSIVMKLDDQKVIAEYDPERRVVKYKVDEALMPGKHILFVWAKDNSDNEKMMRYAFTVTAN